MLIVNVSGTSGRQLLQCCLIPSQLHREDIDTNTALPQARKAQSATTTTSQAARNNPFSLDGIPFSRAVRCPWFLRRFQQQPTSVWHSSLCSRTYCGGDVLFSHSDTPTFVRERLIGGTSSSPQPHCVEYFVHGLPLRA